MNPGSCRLLPLSQRASHCEALALTGYEKSICLPLGLADVLRLCAARTPVLKQPFGDRILAEQATAKHILSINGALQRDHQSHELMDVSTDRLEPWCCTTIYA